ncbi:MULTISPECIES: 16S rRNA (uracil(1498)-N(3))-methyltransferase [unclassified Rhodococcus (in: high G+C Gram-positive bacteria)]|uniref:16S rRNA (uracil(1498)-N(3))-methyltransferase n=1 Tax=unclassified Rhodococcus (in: high G+C Gram-positive bacteria) TaxID=192944 RepID=UPI000483F502|nr:MULTISPECIES: 16S rRNA (uracil(1498)-N(3))-methyltransferase [unclassified Rhodococcus (in: high G+C Gram-positive bacteria)]MBY6708433.1 16S rRNA (uracil(1498)-N(3))-methyltransferase [Rhodococcus sp. BP-241]
MAATVYFLDPLPSPGESGALDGAEGRHAATVRRTTVGERLVLSDGRGSLAAVEVTGVEKARLSFTVLSVTTAEPPRPTVTVIQALPKSERSELAVETATEAGADAIVPWQSLRCVSRWDGPKAVKGVAKWRNAASAAAKQARRAFVPDVADLHDTRMVRSLVEGVVARGGIVVALHEAAPGAFADLPFRGAPEVVLVVGPEGGLDDTEIDMLVGAGATPALLGPTVLRTSTAAAVALGALGVLTDRWDGAPPA